MLTRKVGEVLNVGDNITVTVVDVRGDKVRIGIEASPEVKILRSELEPAETEVEG